MAGSTWLFLFDESVPRRMPDGALFCDMSLRTIILAAGKGTRMKSDVPKVLHKVAGRPLVHYVLDVAKALRSLKICVVVGHQAENVKAALPDGVDVVVQPKLLGTADAVRCARGSFADFAGDVLIMCGDTPLLDKDIIRRLVKRHQTTKAACTFLSAVLQDPAAYGRIIRGADNRVQAIREYKDASADEKRINEINVGVYCFRGDILSAYIGRIKPNPKKKEFYLTDIIELLLKDGKTVEVLKTEDESAAFGVNDRKDLAQAEAVIRMKILQAHMSAGVTLIDPGTTYIEHDVKIGQDTVIYPFTVIHAGVRIGRNCSVGPFARLRPGARLADAVEIGNFSEISRTSIGTQSLMKHFGFLGDTRVGANVNIGAGTITANYDGVNKNVTEIGDGAFIGSDAILIAPLKIGKKARVGAGSVVTGKRNVPDGATVVGVPARVIQTEKR